MRLQKLRHSVDDMGEDCIVTHIVNMDLRDLSAPLVSAEDTAIKEWNKRKEDEQ